MTRLAKWQCNKDWPVEGGCSEQLTQSSQQFWGHIIQWTEVAKYTHETLKNGGARHTTGPIVETVRWKCGT